MRVILIAIFSIFVVGCKAPTKVEINDLEVSTNMVVEDVRPKKEKEFEMFSYIITNDAYAITREGEPTAPAPLRILQHRVHQKLSGNQQPSSIKVHHFVIYKNSQAELKRSTLYGAFAGGIGAVLASTNQSHGVNVITNTIASEDFYSIGDEYKRGLYTESENPHEASVYVVYLDAEIDGNRKFIKVMTPIVTKKESEKAPIVFAVDTAISYFLEQYYQ